MSTTDRESLRAKWVSQYRLALAQRPLGMPRRDVAEAIAAEAKQAEGDGFRISVRALEVWRRTATGVAATPAYSAKTVGKHIRKLRTGIGWTQAELSRASGVDASLISAYEHGHRLPDRDNLIRLAVALCASMEQVLFGVKTHVPCVVRQRSSAAGVRAAARHRRSLRSDRDWVTCRRAAELTGLTKRAWQRIAHGKARVGLARKRKRPGSGRKAVWWVHRSVVEARMAQCAQSGGRRTA